MGNSQTTGPSVTRQNSKTENSRLSSALGKARREPMSKESIAMDIATPTTEMTLVNKLMGDLHAPAAWLGRPEFRNLVDDSPPGAW